MNNVFLIRWLGGWAERVHAASVLANGRMEAVLGLGAQVSIEEAYRIADAQLEEFAAVRAQTKIGIKPTDSSDTPYLGFNVADRISVQSVQHRVLGMAVTRNAKNGLPVFTPILNDDLIIDADARVIQAIRKMIPGTLGGKSKVAQPIIPVYQPRALAPLTTTDDVEWYAEAVRTSSSGLVTDNLIINPAMSPTLHRVGDRVGLIQPPDTPPATYDYWHRSRGVIRHSEVGSADHFVEVTVDSVGTTGATDSTDTFNNYQVAVWGRMVRGEGGEDFAAGNYSGYRAMFGNSDVGGPFALLDVQLSGAAMFSPPSFRGFQFNELSGVTLGANIAPGDVCRMEISGTANSTVIVLKVNGSTVYTWNGPPGYWSGIPLVDPTVDLPNTGKFVGYEIDGRTPDKSGASQGMPWTAPMNDVVAFTGFTAG